MMRSAAVAAVAVVAILLSAPVAASATCTGDTDWTAATYQNGWSTAAMGSSVAAARYRRDGAGVVHVGGVVSGGAAYSVELTLPAGYRPDAGTFVGVASTVGSTTVVIKTDGTVGQAAGGTAGWQSVELSFYVGPDCTGGSGSSGMTNPMTTPQDLIVAGASGAPGRLAVGSSGQVLAVGSGGAVGWATAASTSLNLASFTGDALATVNQAYSLVLVIGALLVLGVGYTIASGLRK